MFWNKELTYWITPKSGPMRGMATLIDANKTNIPNPNVLNVGDIVIIPSTTPTALPGASPNP